MDEADPRLPHDARVPFVESRAALALLLVGAAVVFTAVSDRPLSHSEARYVEAGREMVASGDWVVPHLSFVAYFEKPILTYWIEAASQLAFGTGMIAVRVPSILACVAMTWTAYAFGRSLRGAAFGLGAGALLVASAMFQEMGCAITTDPLFSAFCAFAWYAFWRHDRARQSAWIWAFWAALGFAVLTKGPLGVVLAGVSVGGYLVLVGRLRDVLAMRLVRGAAVVVAINLPWTVLVWRRDPRYLEFFYVRENFQAFFNGSVNHPGPPYYYVPLLLLALFPFAVLTAWAVCAETWTGAAPAVRRLLGRDAPVDESRLYLACSFLFPFLFLSVSASKLATYILPLFPTMALLVAANVAEMIASPTVWLRRLMLAQGAVLGVVAAVVPFAVMNWLPGEWAAAARANATTLWIAAAALLLPMLAGGVAMARGRVVGGMATIAVGSLACVLVVNATVPELSGDAVAADLVRRMKEFRRAGERVIVSGPVSDDYSITLELRERPVIWGKTAELGMGHFTEVTPPSTPIPELVYKIGDGEHPLPQNPWLVDLPGLRAAFKGAERLWFVGRTKDVVWLRENGFVLHVLAEKSGTSVATNLPLPADR